MTSRATLDGSQWQRRGGEWEPSRQRGEGGAGRWGQPSPALPVLCLLYSQVSCFSLSRTGSEFLGCSSAPHSVPLVL